MMALDVFCGAGGASLGMDRAGLTVHGYDHWQPAVDTHNANGLPATLLDLSTDDPPHPGEPFAMWASPPCQPFSAAGDGAGEFDGRDGFPWLLRIVGRLLPEVLFVENVKGLTFEGHAAYFGGVLASLRALGYDVQWKVLNSADLGVPQTRERCIIVARRDGGPISWPAPTHTETEGLFTRRWVTMAEALGWHGELAYRRGEGMMERHGERGPWDTATIPAPTVHRNSEKDWLLVAGSGENATTRRVDEPAPTIKIGHDTTRHRWMLDRRASEPSGVLLVDPAIDPAPTGTGVNSQWTWTIRATDQRSVEHAGANGPTFDPAVRPSRVVTGDGIRVWAEDDQGSRVTDAIRLTIAELACLQGFPPDWIWTGTKTAQARQVGNACPAQFVEAIVRANLPMGEPCDTES